MRKATGYRNICQRGINYYYRFKNEAGVWIERRYGTNLQDAILAQTRSQQEADAIRNGLTTRAKIDARRHESRPYASTLKEFIEHLKASRNTPTHVQQTNTRCTAIGNALEWKTLDDIQPGPLDNLLTAVLQTRSVRTRNDYLFKIQAFVNWCVDRRRYMPSNPLRSLKGMNERMDQKRPVRALTPEEFNKLLEAAPAPRQLAYWLAGGLGLRWSEIRRVRWSNVDLERGWITLPASISKNRKETAVPLPPTVAKALKGCASMDDEVCPHPPILRTFKLDVKAAGITKTEAGAVHRRSLRKTFITHLAMSGVDLRTAQRLARHSRPELTANIYTDPHLLDMKDAMRRIGRLHGRGAVSSGNNLANADSPKRKRKSA
jgi:integrase